MLPFTDPLRCSKPLTFFHETQKEKVLDMVFLAITVNVDIKKDAETQSFYDVSSYSESSDVLC